MMSSTLAIVAGSSDTRTAEKTPAPLVVGWHQQIDVLRAGIGHDANHPPLDVSVEKHAADRRAVGPQQPGERLVDDDGFVRRVGAEQAPGTINRMSSRSKYPSVTCCVTAR